MKVLGTTKVEVRRKIMLGDKFSMIAIVEIDVTPRLLVLDTTIQEMAQTGVRLIHLLEPVEMAGLLTNAT